MPKANTFSQADIDEAVKVAEEKKQAEFNKDNAALRSELDRRA